MQLSQISKELTVANHSIDCDDVELTEDELSDLIRKAKIAKAGRLASIAYAEKLRKELVRPEFSAEELQEYIFQRFPGFEIDEWNKKAFDALCLYFANDPEFENYGNDFSLSKGIMMYGPIGCGKTFLMDVFSINTKLPYNVIECLEIASDYSERGEEYLSRYFNLSPAYPQQNLGHDQIGWCFDDLGQEDTKKRFGNSMNTLEYILSRAYRNEMSGKIHITTNLTGDDIGKIYGPRLRSRMREMFNVIHFSENAPDRRK